MRIRATLISAIKSGRRRGLSDIVSAIFRDASPGLHFLVEEAIKANEAALGPELTEAWVTPNGYVNTCTTSPDGAVTAISTDAATATRVATLLGSNFVAGKTYLVRLVLTNNNGGAVSAFVREGILAGSGTVIASANPVIGAVFTMLFQASGSVYNLLVANNSNGRSFSFNKVSVKEIDLSKCQAFQDPVGTLPVVAMEQPLGLLLDTSGRGNHAYNPASSTNRPTVSRRVNLLNATATLATQSVTVLAASHTLAFSGAGSVTLSGAATGTYSAGSRAITTTAGTLTVAVTGSVTSADLRLASDAIASMPAYQRVTSQTDYDEVGFPAYASFDGLDDWLETGEIDMTSTDEVTAVASVMKLSDVSTALVAEVSSASDATNGSFGLFAPAGGGVNKYTFRSRGTSDSPAVVNSSVYDAPHKSVISGLGRVATDTSDLRVNGGQVASSSSDQGTGNYGKRKLYIGRRGGASLPFKGRLYGLTIVGKLLPDNQLLMLEAKHRNTGKVY